MKLRIFSLCIALLLVLAGCGQKKAEKPVFISSKYEDTSSDTTPDDTQPEAPVYELSGGDNVLESLMGDDFDESNTGSAAVVEKGTQPSTVDTKWDASNTSPVSGGASLEAANMREKVLSAKNTSEYYKWSGRTFYVSPDGNDDNDGLSPQTAIRTLNADAVYMNPLKPGDAVLFERGGVWRMTTSISTREGVTYGSYGTGEKPTFYGSAENYADEKYWTPSQKENIWKLTISDTDIGLIVFNHGELVSHKKMNGITALGENGDYYHNHNDDTIYLYFDKGNPGKYFKDIEVCLNKAAFSIGKDNVVLDNLRIKYYGRFGVSMCDNDNTKITNCEFGFIGGAIQSGTVRYGNAIQQWNSTDKQLIENCWIYQCYDTGITFQGNDSFETGYNENGERRVGDKVYYKDVSYINNLIEYCVYAIEFWHGDNGVSHPVRMENVDLSGNILRFSGYGWSAEQRPDKNGNAFYTNQRWFPNAKGCKIQNNILDVSKRALVYWSFVGGPYGEFDISGNSFYQALNPKTEGLWYGRLREATSQSTLEAAVTAYDKNPLIIRWLDK